jgi:hypothetical protein
MRNVHRISLLVALLLATQSTALAWHDAGHMVVAQIAFDRLDAPVKSRVVQLASQVKFENGQYDPLTVACWMDDLRAVEAFEPLKDWHYINIRFVVSGPTGNAPAPPINAVTGLEWAIKKLSDPTSSERGRAYALAILMHLGGDIHQPLHASTRYTTKLPQGDAGGNFFPLNETLPLKNLHAYWDAAGGMFGQGPIARPLSEESTAQIAKHAETIAAANPPSSIANLKDLRPRTWANESHALARSVVYKGIAEQGTPDDAYMKKTQATSSKRIAAAGYRLAAVLNRALKQ